MNTSKIAAGIIIKNDTEIDVLKRCLDSIAPYVDGIYLTVTQEPYEKLKELANQYGAQIDIRAGEFDYIATEEETVWLKEFLGFDTVLKPGAKLFFFDNARNANLDFIPDSYDWLFWIDADDVLLNGPQLKTSADQAFNTGEEAIFYNFIYQHKNYT